jgi:DNA polymerase-3 subunit alpha
MESSIMSFADFVHLRVHTAYSLLEGAIKIKDLAKLCEKMEMPAVAMTDTGNLFGALEFSDYCAKAGIQPIIGCQLAIEPFRWRGEDNAKISNGPMAKPDQLVVLAQNQAGYRNLLKLVSQMHVNAGDTGVPALSLEAIETHCDGLIALTGGPAGGIGRLLADGQMEHAEELLTRLKAAFPDRLYVEIMRHGLNNERAIEGRFVDLAYKHDVPLVATNECFFSDEGMYEAHDALICIAEGAYVGQTGRRRLTPEHRFKSAQEMRALFADLPEAVDNTLVIARRCAVIAETRKPLLPPAPKEAGDTRSDPEALAELAKEGLEERLAVQVWTSEMSDEEREHAAKPYRDRLAYELDVIAQMGFPGYFLIVSDFIRWAKMQGIPVGPGRGSGAGSVVAWATAITDLDPLRWGLLFERFLNPERVSMPDFDVDFCQDRRDEVIRYVQEKYGSDRVAQIITFGTLQPRAALRDVGRVLQMPYPQVDRICKLVPNNPAAPVTLQQAIDGEPLLREEIKKDDAVKHLVGIAIKLEGLYRHASTHAAGVVIGDRDLTELVPLYRDPRSGTPVTQFSMKWVEAAGLVKFDFLGLKTLTVLKVAVDILRERGIPMDLDKLPLDDRKSYELMASGDTTGVFQLESTGMRDMLRGLKPDKFEDIIAMVSLYRPGPMDNIPSYIRRKHGQEQPDYLYPSLEQILKETYGIMIYQEQVMQIAQELAGYSLGAADLLRRAMGKKIKSEMDAQRKTFVEGAVARAVPEGKASDIFDQMAKFAGYGFNKSHAAAYALVAYQTAYLKANYPVEFMAATMTLDMHNTDKLGQMRLELKRLGVSLLPPDINLSDVTFKVENLADGSGAIRYALAAVKNVGAGAMQGVVGERDKKGAFKDVSDFARRLDSKAVNKRQLENLVRAGAFDLIAANRKQLFDGIEAVLRHATVAREERESAQIGLFGGEATQAKGITLPSVPDWLPMDKLREEFGAIGFHLSSHPLDAYEAELERLRVKTYDEVAQMRADGSVRLAGVVEGMRIRTSQKGNKYAFVQLSDASGQYEITVFSEVLVQARELLTPGKAVLIKAGVQVQGEQKRITAVGIDSLDKATANTTALLKIFIDDAQPLGSLQQLLSREKKGKGEVILVSRVDAQTEIEMRLPQRYEVSPMLAQAVKAIPGIVDVRRV